MARSEYPSPLILDATVLSNFALTDSIHLLTEDEGIEPITATAVAREIAQGIHDGYDFLGRAATALELGSDPDIVEEDDYSTPIDQWENDVPIVFVEPIISELEIESEAAADLDSGEKHALAAAIRHDATIATDDLAAREVADALGIPLTGSVGLLIRLVQRGTIDEDEADEIHQRWVDEGNFRSPVDSVSEVL
jgi:predicted nucleic acid-binding protein